MITGISTLQKHRTRRKEIKKAKLKAKIILSENKAKLTVIYRRPHYVRHQTIKRPSKILKLVRFHMAETNNNIEKRQQNKREKDKKAK